MKRLTIFLLKTYKATISKILVGLFGHGCRFQPTCSEYALLAVENHGVVKGVKLSIKRLSRCHPFSKGYFDPVPKKLLN